MVIRQIALSIALAVSTAAAASPLGIEKIDVQNLDPELLKQVQQLSDEARAGAAINIRSDDARWLEDLAAKTATQPQPAEPEAPKDQEKKHPLGDDTRTLIFVSWSMGASAIKDIMLSYEGRPGTGIVFRGIPDGMKMIDAVTKMHMLTQETQSTVSVLLDPLAFRRHGIDAVPAIVLEDADDKPLVKATGTSSVRLVEQAMGEGKKPGTDLGIHGPTSEIIEPDLMDVAQARIEALDTEAMKKRAIDRFWHNQRGNPLPPVTEPAIRMVDPTVIIPEDILDPAGNVVQKAGRINPLEMMPFNQKLVVIDPTQPWQVQLAKREYQDHGQSLIVTVMATEIPASLGWELFEATQEAVDAPLYLLNTSMADRFQILRAPSVVTAEGMQFKVREISQAEFEGEGSER